MSVTIGMLFKQECPDELDSKPSGNSYNVYYVKS